MWDSIIKFFSSNFFSSILGVFVGGWITYKVNMKVLKGQYEYGIRLEKFKEVNINIKTLISIISELQNNIILIRKLKSLKNTSDEGVHINLNYFPFEYLSWETHKNNILLLLDEDDLTKLSWFYYQTHVFISSNVALSEMMDIYEEAGVAALASLRTIKKNLETDLLVIKIKVNGESNKTTRPIM
jgi:hypothetical protein